MNTENFYTLLKCRLCDNDNLEKFLELKPTPAGNNFLSEEQLVKNYEPEFPLILNFCMDCSHIQLGHVVNPEFLFKDNYHFVSGTSKVNIDHFESYADEVIKEYNLQEDDLVIDIGSNDGTCLEAFKKRKMRVLGIDPAINIAKIANEKGIETISSFFSKELAIKIKNDFGSPKLITSHNVLAHVENFPDIINGIQTLMNEDSIFIFEVGYFYDVFKNFFFDTIYHEHLDYHTVIPLIPYFKKNNMELFKIERKEIQGGSLRNFIQLKSARNKIDVSVSKMIQQENIAGINTLSKLKEFQDNIDNVRNEFSSLMSEIKNNNNTIAGYGAPTKSTTMLNYFNIDGDIIDYIIDDNPLKQNKFTPKFHIPVVPIDYMEEDYPDYLVILAWNFADSIIEKVRKTTEYNGKFIIPLPNVRII